MCYNDDRIIKKVKIEEAWNERNTHIAGKAEEKKAGECRWSGASTKAPADEGDAPRPRKRPTDGGDTPRSKKRETNRDGQEELRPRKRPTNIEGSVKPKKHASQGERKSGKKRRKKKKQRMDTLSLVLLLVAIVVFCFSAFSLIRIGLNYKKGTDTYQELEAAVVTEATPDGTEAQPDNADTRAMAYTPPYVNFDNLLQINPETEAWILLAGHEDQLPHREAHRTTPII